MPVHGFGYEDVVQHAAAAWMKETRRTMPASCDSHHPLTHGSSLLADVLVPDLGLGRDELVHELHALR